MHSQPICHLPDILYRVKQTSKEYTLKLDKIVGGGQALGTLDDGRKAFVWGGLPGETVTVRETKRKSKFIEAVVTAVHDASPERIAPIDPNSYLSTSPWQIMTFDAEQHYKAALIVEAFELHNVTLPDPIDVYTDNVTAHYRNKVEFSWYSETEQETDEATDNPSAFSQPSSPEGSAFPSELDQDNSNLRSSEPDGGDGREKAGDTRYEAETLDLAFFRRGSKGKIKVDSMSLPAEPMMNLARQIRDFLRAKHVTARQLKTLLIRCDADGNCVWQLYTKEPTCDFMSEHDASRFNAQGGEVIYSDPRSPASRITKRLFSVGDIVLSDTILGVPFRYATEGFFQVNLPVYEQALRDMHGWVTPQATSSSRPQHEAASAVGRSSDTKPIIDLYSGVGTIGLTIGGDNCTLIEIDENAVREMKRNISELGSNAKAVLAPAEKALEYIDSESIVIVDPPRAGLHTNVTDKLLEANPSRIIYLSCNPVTQARDVALLSEKYRIVYHRAYNFFPRTPHIENLVVLDLK